MFDTVLIPYSVYDEVVVKGAGKVGEAEVKGAKFIKSVRVKGDPNLTDRVSGLSQVDVEIIVLAKKQQADLIVTRDRRLIRKLRQLNLKAITTTELFIAAKQRGFIESVKPLLDELQDKGVLIRDATYREILRLAGEEQ